MRVLLFLRKLYPTNTVQCVILLLLNLLVSKVTTFSPFEWMKDAVDYEHCGSVWIEPDIKGRPHYNIYRQHDELDRVDFVGATSVTIGNSPIPIIYLERTTL